MAHTNGESGPRFRVGMLESAKEELREIAVSALDSESDADIPSAFRSILHRLERDPRAAGEPLYHLRKSMMTVRCFSVAPLYVVYGVHDEQPVVVIRYVVAFGGKSA